MGIVPNDVLGYSKSRTLHSIYWPTIDKKKSCRAKDVLCVGFQMQDIGVGYKHVW